MNSNIPRAIGMLEGVVGAIEFTGGKVDIEGVKKSLKEAIGFLYNEAPHLKKENNEYNQDIPFRTSKEERFKTLPDNDD